jgi:hypothetical protein
MSDSPAFGRRSSAALSDEPGPIGMGGWLFLPLALLAIAPLWGIYELRNVVQTFNMLSQAPPLQANFIINEAIWNFVLLIVVPLLLLVFFARRSRWLPRLYLIWLVAMVIFVFADLAFAYFAFRLVFDSGAAQLFSPDVIRNILQAVIALVVVGLYLLRSRRVRLTFVN